MSPCPRSRRGARSLRRARLMRRRLRARDSAISVSILTPLVVMPGLVQPCAGHLRLTITVERRGWMAGTSPAKTVTGDQLLETRDRCALFTAFEESFNDPHRRQSDRLVERRHDRARRLYPVGAVPP